MAALSRLSAFAFLAMSKRGPPLRGGNSSRQGHEPRYELKTENSTNSALLHVPNVDVGMNVWGTSIVPHE